MNRQSELPPTKPRRRIVRNVLFSLLAKTQSAIFSYLSTLILLHALKVEEYGFWSLLFIGTTSNLALVARLGLTNSIRRFIPEYFSQSRYRVIARLFHVSNQLQLAASVLLILFAFFFAETIADWMKFPHSEDLLRIFSIGVLAFLLGENTRFVLSGLFMQRAIFIVNLVYSILRLAGLYIAMQFADPFRAVIVAEVILYAAMLVFYYAVYYRFVHPLVKADTRVEDRPPWRRFARYTALSYVSELGVMLLNSATDLFLVTGYLGAAAVALYGLANRILVLVHNMLPSKFLEDVITPLFHSEYGAAPERAQFGFTLLIKSSLLMTIPMGIWLALMAQPLIVQFFDPRYGEAAAIVVIMGLFLPMETLRYPLGLMLQNAERNDLLIYGKIFGVFKILLGIWLVPRGGLATMVWITSISIVGQNLLFYYWIVRVLKSPTDHVGLLRLLINGVVAGGLFYLISSWFNGVVGVIASIFVFSAIWLAVSMLNKVFSSEEREFINSKLPYPVWKF
ncbi:MAG: lipopolysaccharide biosynthesis protein [Calditrichota bacterium]